MTLRIVVLSHKSLFADGIVSQLRARAGQVDVEKVDAGLESALERVRAIKPQVVLLDVNDTDVFRRCPVPEILQATPGAQVMQLDPNSDDILIYRASFQRARGISELVEVMERVAA
jgi:DNA-binding NarL/FixJ family response regulator